MKKRLLPVCDDESFCDRIELRLTRLTVKGTQTIVRGLMLARNQIYDLYIIDNRLPDGSSARLCSDIRKFDHDTPILFLSDPRHDSDRLQAIEAGASASLGKPIDFLQLESIVASLIRRAEAARVKAAVVLTPISAFPAIRRDGQIPVAAQHSVAACSELRSADCQATGYWHFSCVMLAIAILTCNFDRGRFRQKVQRFRDPWED